MESLPSNIGVTRMLLNAVDGKVLNPETRLLATNKSTSTSSGSGTTANTATSQNVVPPAVVTPTLLAALNAAAAAAAQVAADLSQAAYIASQSLAPISQSYNNLKFQLPRAFIDVIHVDWTFCSGLVAPCFCAIDELEQNGLTLSGIPYWKYLYDNSSHTNNTSPYLPIRTGFPRVFNTLTVSLFDQNGNPINQNYQGWTLELVIFYKISE